MAATGAHDNGTDDDPMRARLLDAAVTVFARKGYDGTKILDIVRECGLSTGAVYGRFASKRDLLLEAVTARSRRTFRSDSNPNDRVADLIARLAEIGPNELTDDEAVRIEAYVAARREPEVASALHDSHNAWRHAIQPIVDRAMADGSVSDDVDPDAVVHFLHTMSLGLLVQRAAGTPRPNTAAWNALMRTIIASFGDSERTPT